MLAAFVLLGLTVLVDPTSHAITVTADQEQLGDILSAIREKAGLKLMVDGAVERRRVTLDGRYPSGDEALRAVATAAGAAVERSGEVYLVRKPPEPKPRPAGKVEDMGNGRFRAPGTIDYLVMVLRDRPEDISLRASLKGFEGRKGVSLIAATSIKEIAIREYFEARDTYRRILELAALPIELSPEVNVRSARVYLEQATKRYYIEVLFSTGDRGVDVAHFVYVVDMGTLRCQVLYIFKLQAQ